MKRFRQHLLQSIKQVGGGMVKVLDEMGKEEL